MCKPAVSSRTVPVLYIGRYVDNVSREHLYGRFAFFLIPAFAGNADQHLSAAFGCMVDMPVVPAAWLESDIGERNLLF